MSDNVMPGVTSKQRRAVDVLLEGGRVRDAADAAGVTERTVFRWRRDDPAFRSALDVGAADGLRAFALQLLGLTKDARAAFGDALSPSMPISVRLRAASLLTGRLLQIREAIELAERVQALEEQIGRIEQAEKESENFPWR